VRKWSVITYRWEAAPRRRPRQDQLRKIIPVSVSASAEPAQLLTKFPLTPVKAAVTKATPAKSAPIRETRLERECREEGGRATGQSRGGDLKRKGPGGAGFQRKREDEETEKMLREVFEEHGMSTVVKKGGGNSWNVLRVLTDLLKPICVLCAYLVLIPTLVLTNFIHRISLAPNVANGEIATHPISSLFVCTDNCTSPITSPLSYAASSLPSTFLTKCRGLTRGGRLVPSRRCGEQWDRWCMSRYHTQKHRYI
jgi:hypothetical protein